MDKSRVRNVIGWTLQIIFAVLFLLAASGKLLSRPQAIEKFNSWGFPDGFYLIIGVLELLGAVGLLIPRLAGYAASGLIAIMIGATLTHLVNGEGIQVLRPLIFMLALVAIVFVRQLQTSKLIKIDKMNKAFSNVVISGLVPVLILAFSVAVQGNPAIREIDRVRIAEVYRIADKIQNQIWIGWDKAPFGMLLGVV